MSSATDIRIGRRGSVKPYAMVAAVLAGTTVALAGCNAPNPTLSGPAKGPALPAHYGGDDPGSLVSAESLVDLDHALQVRTSLAARITYMSTSGKDGHVKVSGTVFVPKGDPPAGGWKTVALGHPATGIQPECAPSLSPTLLGLLPTISLAFSLRMALVRSTPVASLILTGVASYS